MSKLGGFFLLAFACRRCATTGGGVGGGFAGSGLQATALPPGMTAAQGAAYCSKLSRPMPSMSARSVEIWVA